MYALLRLLLREEKRSGHRVTICHIVSQEGICADTKDYKISYNRVIIKVWKIHEDFENSLWISEMFLPLCHKSSGFIATHQIRHHPNDVFSFTHNLTEGWHTVIHWEQTQQPLSNSSITVEYLTL